MGKQVGFEDVLRYFDEDGDGKVLPSELKHGLGNLGREPQETTGIVELGGASLQVFSFTIYENFSYFITISFIYP